MPMLITMLTSVTMVNGGDDDDDDGVFFRGSLSIDDATLLYGFIRDDVGVDDHDANIEVADCVCISDRVYIYMVLVATALVWN